MDAMIGSQGSSRARSSILALLGALAFVVGSIEPAFAARSSTTIFEAPYWSEITDRECSEDDGASNCASDAEADARVGREHVEAQVSGTSTLREGDAWALTGDSLRVPKGAKQAAITYEVMVHRAAIDSRPAFPLGPPADVWIVAIARLDSCDACSARTDLLIADSRPDELYPDGGPALVEDTLYTIELVVEDPAGLRLPGGRLFLQPWLYARAGGSYRADPGDTVQSSWTGSGSAVGDATVQKITVAFA